MTTNDEGIEILHRTIQEYQQAIDAIIVQCQHQPDGSWLIRSHSGFAMCPDGLGKALTKALMARIGESKLR